MVNVSPEIGHSIKIRCHIQWIAVGSTSVPALLVREKYDHVGLFRHNVGPSIVIFPTLVKSLKDEN